MLTHLLYNSKSYADKNFKEKVATIHLKKDKNFPDHKYTMNKRKNIMFHLSKIENLNLNGLKYKDNAYVGTPYDYLHDEINNLDAFNRNKGISYS